QRVFVDAQDPQTGVKNADFSYWDCASNTSHTNVALTCTAGVCETILDVSSFDEGDRMCFEFLVYNNALDATNLSGSAGFDGTAPAIDVIAPADGAYGANNTIFTYNASDNLAPTLSCDLLLDGTIIDSVTATNAAITTTTYDMSSASEGTHAWNLQCTDWVGWLTASGTRSIIVDKTPPTITLNSPANGSTIPDGMIIDISVMDNYEVDTVTYSASRNASDLPEGLNTLTVTATDKAGNVATIGYAFTVDRTAPTVTLIAPADNSTVDVALGFEFSATDAFDTSPTCTLSADGSALATQDVTNGTPTNITQTLPIAIHTWQVSCTDDAGNVGTSTSWTVNVTDLRGPTIISDVVYVARTEEFPFSATITDPSGVASAGAAVDGSAITFSGVSPTYSGSILMDIGTPLGSHDLTLDATDTYGNPGVLVDAFTLIQGYTITLSASPASVLPGESVTVAGTVVLDDGAAAPEQSLLLFLPGETVNISIVNGTFSTSLSAPGAGTYTIVASIISSEGFAHNKTTTLTVNNPPAPSGGGGGGGGRRNSGSSGVVQPPAPQETPRVNPAPLLPDEDEDKPEEDDDSGKTEDTDAGEVIPEDEPRVPLGVGASTSWFDNVVGNVWAWLLLIIIAIALGIAAFKRKKKDNIDWDGYFEK
ncbi:MAG: Ig-like domain-containing protein, partial [Nanoarchaeota archaeon]